ncbi:Fc.00g013970.m01.CDS01 [Cosmosporella sp. VM-42]
MYASSVYLAAWGVVATAADLVPRQTQAPATTAAETPEVTAITSCHLHASDLYCFSGETEYLVDVEVTATSDVPAQFNDCHSHGSEMFCVDSDGEDVAVHAEGAEAEATEHDHEHEEGEEAHDGEHEEESESTSESQHCHFHAGVEHCTGGEESESAESGAATCNAPSRDYNIGLRVGLLFVILATSTLGVFGPILLHRIMPTKLNLLFIVLKQFGTGIIISTAFVHLYTHAALMFGNECLGELEYEATTSSILMAGLFLSFLVEYGGQRLISAKTKSAAAGPVEKSNAFLSAEVVSILVMEAGIIFHSLLIGLTLVVAGDEFFITLFVVILFHQMFEGIALGTRIATIGTRADVHTVRSESDQSSQEDVQDDGKTVSPTARSPTPGIVTPAAGLSMKKKLGLAALFAFITPIGMAIGIGVLQQFNGNDKSTIIAIGTLDALSAGILVWVGLVEMWAADWMVGAHGHQAELADANLLTVTLAGFGLVGGLVLMSLLGKWA